MGSSSLLNILQTIKNFKKDSFFIELWMDWIFIVATFPEEQIIQR